MKPTYLDLIRRGALQHADRPALIFGDQQMTFAEVDRLSSRLAHALTQAGAGHHSRVALLVNNGLNSVPLDFACVKAGINRVPLNSRLSLAEQTRMLQDTGCQMLVFGPDLLARAAELRDALPELRCLGLGAELSARPDGALNAGIDLLKMASDLPAACDTAPVIDVQPEDVVLTLFTSGTTGTLKAAQHTQSSYAAICRNVMLNLLPVEPDDAMLHSASLIHASGTFVLPFWLRGARTVILPSFEPAGFLRAISQHRITAINLVPTMLQMLIEHPDAADADVSTLRRIIYGASPMPRAVIQRAMALWGQHRFWQYYGQTEMPLCLAVLRPEDHQGDLLGACGQPALDVEIRLIDEHGKPVPPGVPGEILVRGDSRVAGYHNAPQLNEETFDAEGWVHTRDVGMFDERGYLHLKDRTSDMIITGGYNVYPREIEDVLMTHPAVSECAVIGTPDDKWVEAVTAVVVLRAGHAVTQPELIDYVASRVASYKKPQRVVFAAEIPKTAVGKLNRRQVRERYGAPPLSL